MRNEKFKARIFKKYDYQKIKDSIYLIEKSVFKEKAFTPEVISGWFSNPKIIAIILEGANKEIIGFSFGFPINNSTFFIYDTAIKKDFQGKRLISKIMKLLEKELKDRGFKYIEREAEVNNGYSDKIRQHYGKRIIEEGIPHDSDYSNGKQIFFRIKI